ncbi:MAG TPA: 4-hydroxythreonine-4-phosphate dehydrogenase PdxA [Casimicrobiaceae bacterium]
MPSHPTIAITVGEPAGIGPELIAMLARHHERRHVDARLVVIGNRALLDARAKRIGIEARYAPYDPLAFAPPGGAIEVWDRPLAAPVIPGRPDPTNARSVLSTLELACDACATGACAALVTGPVQKATMQDAGLPFIGHTEFLAARTHTPRVVMMLVGATGTVAGAGAGAGATAAALRVALVTTHLALSDVPKAITHDAVVETLAIVHHELIARFAIPTPRIAVCGLNPHAGEGGHIGREEQNIIAPAIAGARRRGIAVDGPLPADTLFVPAIAGRYDVIVAMYHDQGLPVLKAASFGHGINVTLGLPFVRTSVDHGTALDLALDAARAATTDAGSLVAATELAIELAGRASE